MRPLLALLILAATLAVGACSTGSSTSPGLESTPPVVTSPDTSSPVTSPDVSPEASPSA